MQRGLRQAGAAIVHQDGGAHAGSGGGAGAGTAAAYPSHALQYHEQSAPSPGADSLDSLFQQHGGGGGGVAGDHRQQDVLAAAAAAAGTGGDYPSVVGFLYCTFFDDENLWTAEYGGPRDCEVPIQGHVSEGGYLTGTGPHYEYYVDCRVVSGDPNAPGAGAKIVVDGLVRHSDGASMGRCVFEKQRDAGRQGYKGLATWRLAVCRQPTKPADPSSSSSFEATGGSGGGGSGGARAVAMVRPRNRRFSPEYKVMTDADWGDMDVWLALQCASPVFDRVGVDLRPLHFAALTTTDYLDKKQLIALTRGLCAFAGPATFTQSMLDAWGDLHANPVRSARPKYISRIHCRHWLEVFRKIMDFKIGLLLVNSGMLSRKDVSAARMANFGQMAYYNLDQATSVF